MINLARGDQKDPLTGAATEPALLRFLDAVLGMTEPGGPLVGLLCLEVDGLEVLQSRHGQGTVDAVLLGIADRLQEVIRNHDLVGRMGGGFAVCLAEIFPAQAAAAAERLRAAIASAPVATPAGAIPVSCSIGMALGRAQPADALVFQARDAMWTARHRGGDQVVAAP
ncbi:GGDEF domain-containing protein [Siccirubricoccus phaeus]|uniref:GGDEF domain-containing protein n=1 Tax=Siccirubricoccus phaeus TaxID=2595053 RepID=UPI00165BEBAC|nr:GGDEF domain-containing protein [Siccirubricoccus phaeus]